MSHSTRRSGPWAGSFACWSLTLLLLLGGCGNDLEAPDDPAAPTMDLRTPAGEVLEEELSTEYQPLRLVRLVDGLEQPWAVGFLPDGRLLVTERPGRMQLVDEEGATELEGLPPVHAQGQGGLLDVVPHPDYEESGWIYFTYSQGDEDATATTLTRARLDGTALVDVEELFQAQPPEAPGGHYGSRILFLDDGTLLMSVGDRARNPERAQDTEDHAGTLLRLNADGSVPADNPFLDQDGYAPEVFTYGHRNIQGLTRHPATGEIWATEHGPRGGDELNLIQAGMNYGWPLVSLGREYGSQEPWGDERRRDDLTDPVLEFLPTLAPSGLTVVQGGGFHGTWEGNLLAGGLGSQRILRLVVEEGEVLHAEELIRGMVGRIRDVRQGPDGFIYFVTGEGDGGLYRLEPVE